MLRTALAALLMSTCIANASDMKCTVLFSKIKTTDAYASVPERANTVYLLSLNQSKLIIQQYGNYDPVIYSCDNHGENIKCIAKNSNVTLKIGDAGAVAINETVIPNISGIVRDMMDCTNLKPGQTIADP